MSLTSFFLILLFSLTGASSACLSKVYVRTCSPTPSNNNIFLFFNSLFACIYFAVSVRFALTLDVEIAKYSVIYATLISVHLLVDLISLRMMSLVLYLVFQGFGSTIVPCIAETIVFDAPITPQTIISIVLMSLAILLPIFFAKQVGMNIKSTIFGLLIMLTCGCANFFGKFIVANQHVNDNASSLFFFTNLFMMIIPITLMIQTIAKGQKATAEENDSQEKITVLCKKKSFIDRFRSIFPGFGIIPLLVILLCTISSNSGSLLSIILLRRVSMTLLSISSRAFSLLFSLLASLFIFKENVRLPEIIALLLSLAGSIVIIL